MLKSIVNFLKLRFPAIMTGTNIIMSWQSSVRAICSAQFGHD